MFKQGFEYMCEIYTLYFKNFWYLVLVGMILLALLTKYRSEEGKKLLQICGIIWLLFLNPVVIYLVCSLKGAVTGRYVRIFWLFPFVLGSAYVGVRLMKDRKIYQKVLILVFILAIFWATGGSVLSEKNFVKASNLYKLPDDVIEVADKIEENKKDEWEHPCVMANYHLSIYLRQYDGDIIQLYGREPIDANGWELFYYLYMHAADEIVYDELYYLGEQAHLKGVNVIVLAKYQVQSQALEAVGYQCVDSTEDYYIYCYEGMK